MLKMFRTIGLAAWTLALVLIYFTTEIVADELGWTTFVKDTVKQGPKAMLEAGYDAWLLAIFWILTGGLIVSWADFIFRRFEAKRQLENWVHFTIAIEAGKHTGKKHVGVEEITTLDGTLLGNIYTSDPKVSKNSIALVIQFENRVVEPCPYVCADRMILWREIKANSNYLILELDLVSKDDVALAVIVRPKEWLGGIKHDPALRWHDASVLKRETVLRDRFESKKRQWIPNIATKTPL